MEENKHDDGVEHRVSGPVAKQTEEEPSFFKETWNFVKDEYIIPKSLDLFHNTLTGIINVLADTAIGAADKTFEDVGGGNYRPGRSSRYGGTSSQRDYNKISTQQAKSSTNKNDGRIPINERPYANPVVVHDHDEAIKIKNEMIKLIEDYGQARVGDIYELAGRQITGFTDWKYGWVDPGVIRFRTERRDVFVFDLPDPVPVNSSN